MHETESCNIDQKPNAEFLAGGLVALDNYRRSVGRSKTTFWRYRRQGWLPTMNILGRLYVTREAIDKFEAAVADGQLAKPAHGCARDSARGANSGGAAQ